MDFPDGSDGKESSCSAEDLGLILGLGRSPEEGNSYPLQYSGPENSMDCSPQGSSVHGESPGKNTGVGCHALLQGIFPTQGSNPGLPHCRWILYHLSNKGSPRILEWVISVQFSRSVMSDSLRPHESQHARPPCPSPTPGVH